MIEFQLSRKGILFVMSAPSGGGKSTVVKSLLKSDDSISYSVSATTRKAREGERDGEAYHFMPIPEFKRLIEVGAFYEWAEVHGNYYGTLRREVDTKLAEGHDILLDLDVQGSLKLKNDRPDCVLIFILPPSIATLQKRLRSRGLDDEAAMTLRLENARNEIRYAPQYDYVMVNEDLPQTIEDMKRVIYAERCNARRLTLHDALGEVDFLPRNAPEARVES